MKIKNSVIKFLLPVSFPLFYIGMQFHDYLSLPPERHAEKVRHLVAASIFLLGIIVVACIEIFGHRNNKHIDSNQE